jgi:hypothetical protein
MSDNTDPGLADSLRSVRALGEDRFGVEPDGDEHGAQRVHPAPALDDEDEEDDEDATGK